MAPFVSSKDYAPGIGNAVSARGQIHAEGDGLDLAPFAGANLDAPASPDVVVNPAALLAAYGTQGKEQTGLREGWPAMAASSPASALTALSSLARQVTDCQDQIERLKASSRSIIEQRDQWRLRAQQAEARMAGAARPDSASEEESHYIALKHRLAKMLHPDSPSRSLADKSECEALFIRIWEAIDQIEQGGTERK